MSCGLPFRGLGPTSMISSNVVGAVVLLGQDVALRGFADLDHESGPPRYVFCKVPLAHTTMPYLTPSDANDIHLPHTPSPEVRLRVRRDGRGSAARPSGDVLTGTGEQVSKGTDNTVDLLRWHDNGLPGTDSSQPDGEHGVNVGARSL